MDQKLLPEVVLSNGKIKYNEEAVKKVGYVPSFHTTKRWGQTARGSSIYFRKTSSIYLVGKEDCTGKKGVDIATAEEITTASLKKVATVSREKSLLLV